MRLIFKIAAAIAAAAYIGMALIPTRHWFDPSVPVFADAPQGTAPKLTYNATIGERALIRYSTTTRIIKKTGGYVPECQGDNGSGFVYQPRSGPIVGKDLVWWSGDNPICASLPVGDYWTSTTWVIPTPIRTFLPGFLKNTVLQYLMPPRRVTRDSPAFVIYEPLKGRDE